MFIILLKREKNNLLFIMLYLFSILTYPFIHISNNFDIVSLTNN